MKKLLSNTLAFTLFVFGNTIASAHHSAAPFDFSQTVSVTGTIVKFDVRNPHTAAILVVSDNERGTREIEFEGMSASTFYRAGYTRNSIKTGDSLEIIIAPRFTGEDGGFIMSFIDPNGKEIGFSRP